ncbi:unnamed protein product, partial [Vitis vinifera]|uniref:Uncharacterized protein n=1 Tax=Vitis vinifera TaxID=29760 RepID=D7T7X9_VITVI
MTQTKLIYINDGMPERDQAPRTHDVYAQT